MEQPEVARNLNTVIVHTIFFPDWKLAGPAVIRLTFMMGTFCFSIHAIASGLRRSPFNRNFCQFSALVVEYILGLVQVSLCTLTLVSINQYFCVVRQQKYLTFSCKKKKKTSKKRATNISQPTQTSKSCQKFVTGSDWLRRLGKQQRGNKRVRQMIANSMKSL